MAEFSFPFDVSVAGDRTVTADTFGTMLNAMVTNGVVKDADDALAVSQSGTPAMSVSVATGRAFVGHTSKRRYYRNTSALTLTIEAADGSNPRDDLIVLEMAEATGTRSVALKVVKGTAAGSPSDPSLTTTEATFQFAIARVRVGTGVSTIVNANITDLRSTNGFAGMALGAGEISQLTTDTISSGDFIGFSDEDESGDPTNKITIDNLMETALNFVTEDTVAVASDYMVFLDGGASGNANKESIAHFVSAIAGTGLSESSGQLVVSETGDISGVTAGDGISGGGTTGAVTVAVDLGTNSGLEIDSAKLQIAKGISEHDVAQFTSGVADDDFLRVAGTVIEGRSASEVLSDIGASAVAGSSSIVTVGAVNAGSITSGFTSIDVGSGTIDTTGAVGTGALNPADTVTIADGKDVHLDSTQTDNNYSGVTATFSNATGSTIAKGKAVYISGDNQIALARANADSTMPAIGIAIADIANSATGKVLLSGFIHDSDILDCTIGGEMYVSEDTAGVLTKTLPASSGDRVQVVGVGLHADKMFFNPSYDIVERG